MSLNKILQGNYSIFSFNHQIKLPIDLELSIPDDDPVRLVSAFVEEMNLSDLYATYERIRKGQASPRQMMKIVIYAAMNRVFSSRDIETACKKNVLAQSVLLAIGFDLNKLHHKIKSERTGTHLFDLKKTA